MPKSLDSTLLQEVFTFSSTYLKKSDMRRATEQYFGEDASRDEANEDEFYVFIGWMLHDYRDPATGRTPIEHYLIANGLRLKPRDRALLESLRDARYSLLEVESVEPERGVHVRNVGSGEQTFIEDLEASIPLSPGSGILVRLRLDEGRWLATGDSKVVNPDLLPAFVKSIERESETAGQSVTEYVQSNSHRLHRMLEELKREHESGPRLVMRPNGPVVAEEKNSAITPEQEADLVRLYKSQHYSTWSDTPLPALKGKTAREAVRSPQGRKAVVKLLREMERDERRKPETAYDFNEIRRELGLDEE
jgi:hypothetical protein